MKPEPLPSWNEGPARSAILDFLATSELIPPEERVAVFDNDGTLWCEKPNYIQLEFMLNGLAEAAAADPTLGEREEYRALLEGDRRAIGQLGLERIALALVDLHVGITPEAFTARVREWAAQFRHRDLGLSTPQLRYQPMLELLAALRAHGFDVYLVTGGGTEFVRAISESFYGVPPEGVVGSQIDYAIADDTDGALRLVRSNKMVGPANEGRAKPGAIHRILGRRPVVAAGNSAGDTEMLRYAQSAGGPSLALLIDHDDAEREYAYSSVSATFSTDEPITVTAARHGWTVVSMRNDWSTVFATS